MNKEEIQRKTYRMISVTTWDAVVEALEAQHQGLDILFARLIEGNRSFYPSESGLPWQAALKGTAALALAKHQRGTG